MKQDNQGSWTREERRTFDADSRAAGARILGWSVATIVVVAVIVVALFALTVWWAPWQGKGDAFKTKESGTNRISAQEQYVETYNNIVAADKRITVLWKAKKADPSMVNQTNYNGAVTNCVQLVADYDALADKYTSADFRPQGYPARIGALDPATDCKENHA